jgi:hypothetical protein
VSDEGSASQIFAKAAYSSAKACALWPLHPVDSGVALNRERMTSAGEVPIGPEEYTELNAAAAGRLMCTTNVGVRVNSRLNGQRPVTASSATDPLVHTPDGHPRPLTVRLSITPDTGERVLAPAVEALHKRLGGGEIGSAEVHARSALLVFHEQNSAEDDIRSIEKAIEASVRVASRRRLGIQSLLNVLVVEALCRLLAFAERSGVRLTYRYQLDVNSAARTIWTGLHTAQMNGSSAGKYGVAPMTLEEQALTVETMTQWTRGWTAVSAFYVDTPLLAAREVYDDSRCEEAVVVWLKMARGGSAQIILFDSPDRINPRHLVRQSNLANDTRVLTMEAIDRISKCAMELGVSMLWSGGITSHQAYELALRRVFGIFRRSSTATKIAVTAEFERDPRFAAENEPTEFGVRRIHAVIQRGFLANALHEREPELAKKIETKTGQLLDCRTQGACQESKRCVGGRAYSDLHELVFDIAASASEFPELFGKVKFDQPYHLLNTSVDWQSGSTRRYIGTRLVEVKPDAFVAGIGKIATTLQQSPGDQDSVIFCVSEDYLVWWEHSQRPVERSFGLERLSKEVFTKTASSVVWTVEPYSTVRRTDAE